MISANQKRAGISTMAISLSVGRRDILLPMMLQSYNGSGTPLHEDYHNRNRARESYDSMTREMGNDMIGELVFKLPVERFEIWHTEFSSEVKLSISCLRVR